MKRYEEIELLGDGAFGTVTKFRDKETGEIVAIKAVKQRYATFDECLQLKEVKSLRKIKHENIIRMLQVFRENDRLFLVFECLHGSLLKTIKDHTGPFSEPEVRFVVSQMLEGLAYVHRMGFFHRDIKPENLLWSGDTLKIADFGLAREIRSRPPYTEYISTRWYRAPEIVLRHEFYNSPVDIWAVGAIMAELYTLKPLFQGSSETDQLFKICSVLGTPTAATWPDGPRLAARLGIRLPQFGPTPLSGIIPNASPEAIDLMTELLRYDPGRRPSAVQALQHPFFRGEKVTVSGSLPRPAEEEPPQQIAPGDRLKQDEAERVPVRMTEPAAPPRDAVGARWNTHASPAADEEFDDIFVGIL
jgi:protein kinase